MALSNDCFVIRDGVLIQCSSECVDAVIPEGVKAIGKEAFCNCNNLRRVIIPNGVISIGDSAFSLCRELEQVMLPDSLMKIGGLAFYCCERIKEIVIPDSVVSIGRMAFYRCSGLESISLPEPRVRVGVSAFGGCSSLADKNGFVIIKDVLYGYFGSCENAVIPDGVKVIGEAAMSGNPNFTSVTVPKSVVSIGHAAFNNCAGLKSITLPSSEIDIGDAAFTGCRGLADEKGLVIVRGVLYDCFSEDSRVVLPDMVKSIDGDAFARGSMAKALVFPSSITRISPYTFTRYFRFEEIVPPSDVTVFEGSCLEVIWDTFYRTNFKVDMMASFLKYAADPVKNAPAVRNKIMYHKSRIINHAISRDDNETLEKLFEICKRISLDDLDRYIQEDTLEAPECRSYLLEYKKQKYPVELQEMIEKDRLDKALGLKPMSVDDWRKIYTFRNTDEGIVIRGYRGSDTHLVIPSEIGRNEVTSIGRGAFSPDSCAIEAYKAEARAKLCSVSIPGSIAYIGRQAFSGCTNLENVYIDNGVAEIGEEAFSWCDRLKSIRIPNSVTDIGDEAFSWCDSLTEAVISEGVTRIGRETFWECKSLKNVTLPKGLVSIGRDAFYCCESLQRIVLPDGLRVIGEYAFQNCKKLEEIIIPDSVVSIGIGAFDGCDSLKSHINLPLLQTPPEE